NMKILRELVVTIRVGNSDRTVPLGRLPIQYIDDDAMKTIRDTLLKQGYAMGTVKRKLETVSKALRMAATEYKENGVYLLSRRPQTPKLKFDNKRDRVLSYEEERLMFEAIETRRNKEPHRPWWRFARLCEVLIDTGFRKEEGLSLGAHSLIHQQSSYGPVILALIPANISKNGKERTVPLSQRIVQNIEDLNKQAVGGRWFPMKNAWYMWENIRDDMKAMGHPIDDVVIHTFRHTCLTRLCQTGIDLARLSRWAGHSNVKITADRYLHLIVHDLIQPHHVVDIGDSNPGHSVSWNYENHGADRAKLVTVTH
ncbi:MAG: tyrosine-type recombinase/integrase, partial [Chakrabartia sp.]